MHPIGLTYTHLLCILTLEVERGKDSEILIAYFDALPLECRLSKTDLSKIAHIVGCSEWYAELTYRNRFARWKQRMRNKGMKFDTDLTPPPTRFGQPWSMQELVFVQNWYRCRSDTELAKMLNRRFWNKRNVRKWGEVRSLRHKMGWVKDTGWTDEESRLAQFLAKRLTPAEISFLLFLRFGTLRTPGAVRFKLFQMRTGKSSKED